MSRRSAAGIHPHHRLPTVAALLGAAILQPAAFAAVDTWTAGSGNWSLPANWSTDTIPAAGDTVFITNTDGLSRTIAYDFTGPAITLAYFQLDLTGGGTTTLNMTANAFTTATAYLGYSGPSGSNGSAAFTQSGGTVTIAPAAAGFFLGLNATDTGSYTLSGNASLTSNNFEVVGYSGTGTFTQSGGTNTLNPGAYSLYIGELAGSSGTYNLSGGTLTANVAMDVGFTGNGIVNQSGGAVFAGTLTLGASAGATGTYTLTGGALNTAAITVGQSGAGTGTLTLFNGSMTTTGFLSVGPNSALNLSGGALTVGSIGFEFGTGFNWTGGTLNVTANDLTVGGLFFPGAIVLNADQSANFTGVGGFSINSVSGANVALLVGFGNTASFTQNGTGKVTVGTPAIPRNLDLATITGLNATYTLANPATSLIVHGAMYVAGNESGPTGGGAAFNLLAGNATIDTLGIQTGGTVTLSGGTLSIGSLLTPSTPSSNSFSWTGGTVNVTNAAFRLDQDGLHIFSLTLNGAQSGNFTGATTSTLSGIPYSNAALLVGGGGGASFTQNGTGAITVGTPAAPRNLEISNFGGLFSMVPVYNLSNPAATLTVYGNVYVAGFDSQATGNNGFFQISAGAATVTGAIKLWNQGHLFITGGALSVETLDVSANPAGFHWTAGNLALLDGTIYGLSSFTVPASSTLSGSGSIVANITLNGTISLLNLADDLSIHGLTAGPGNITTAYGTFLTADALQVNSLTLAGNALIRPNAGLSTLHSLTLSGTPNNWSARLDLTNNSLIIAADGAPNIANQIKSAATLGTWNGAGGITSSSAHAAATTSTATALGYATGSEFTAATGQTTFSGEAFLPTDTLIKYTLAGDANMDGSVTFADFLALQNNYNKPGDWQQGDWNYDGQVTFADFLILQNNYNKTLPTGPIVPASQLPITSYQLPLSPAPEPASLTSMAVPALLLLARRRPPNRR